MRHAFERELPFCVQKMQVSANLRKAQMAEYTVFSTFILNFSEICTQVTPDVAVELVVRVRDYDIPGTNATYRTRSYCDPAGCSNGLPVFGPPTKISLTWS